MSGESITVMQPGCLPGCTVRHATKVSGCEVTTDIGAVKSYQGEPDLIVRSYVACEGSTRYAEINLSVADDEQGDLVSLDVDQALHLAALLVAACDKGTHIVAGDVEQVTVGETLVNAKRLAAMLVVAVDMIEVRQPANGHVR